MAPTQAPDDDAGTATLGALLYAEPSAAVVPEEEWVTLVAAIGGGDQAALRAMYERTHRIVFTLAVRICRERTVAEEVTVDVFHDVWRRAAAYDAAEGTVIGWVMMLARSRAIDRLRFDQRKKRVDPRTEDGQGQTREDAPDSVATRDRNRTLHAAVAALTPDERQAIETAYFSELTYAEAAERLSLPLGTVKTRVRAALAKLRVAMATEGGSP